MKVLRWLLALAVAAYGLSNLLPIVSTTLYKLGFGMGGAGERMIPVMQATAWWELVAGLAVVTLLSATAWRLARGRQAFGLAVLAFAADAAVWWITHAMAAYQLAVSEAEVAADDYSLIGMAAVLLAIWLVERSRSGSAAA
ncbi:MAG: hypothetical protein E7812_16200 [Phenylobacterium sp.]|nr:MAG: hypothetical protein E7812_16200 [Phenylobacterium sp.]